MIAVNQPVLSKNAKKYVLDCISSGWISSAGSYIGQFEKNFAHFCGVPYATTTTNGTTALHLALAALDIGEGDEVIIPDLTIISCALAVLYTGATPVVADVDPVTGTIDPIKIEKKITRRTRAIMPVHLYGHPADMDPIMEIARKHKLYVVEDAAEAHGAEYKGKKVGSFGDAAAFSFYANKIVTCGEGGMVVVKDKGVWEKAMLLKDLAHVPGRRFVHEEIGYNYRMTNLQAALGVAELEQVEKYIAKKRWMAGLYQKLLEDVRYLELPPELPWAKNVYWMYAVRVTPDSPISKNELRTRLKNMGVDTRDYFYPLHSQPVLKNMGLFKNERCPISDDLSQRGFYLPSGLAITKKQIETVAKAVKRTFL